MTDFSLPVGTLDPNISALGRHVHLATDKPDAGTTGYVLVSNGPDVPATFQPTGTSPPNVHVLATTAGLGAQHSTSGLTSGQVLRATAAAAAAFGFLIASDLPSHTHDAGDIISGIMARARLPSQVAYEDEANIFSLAQVIGTDPGGAQLLRVGGDVRLGNADLVVLTQQSTGAGAYRGAYHYLTAAGITSVDQQSTVIHHAQNNLDATQGYFAIQQRRADNTYVRTIAQHSYWNNSWDFSGDQVSFYDKFGNLRWLFSTSGHLLTGLNNTYDIGDSAATNRPRTGYFATSLVVGTNGTSLSAANFVLKGTGPEIDIFKTDAALDEKNWDWVVGSTNMDFRAVNDANSAAGTALRLTRSGRVIQQVQLHTNDIQRWTVDVNGSFVSSTAVTKIVPGVTSLSLRNNADSADNILVSDAGAVTLRNSFTLAYGGARFIVSDSGGNTGLEFGSTAGTSSTPFIDFHSGATAVDYDTRIIASGGSGVSGGGTLTITAIATLLTGKLFFQPAASAIVPGGTSLSLRNNADNANNLLLTDAGLATFRNDVTTSTIFGSTGTAGSDTTYGRLTSVQVRFKQTGGDEANAGVIDYRTFDSTALSIVGAGNGASNRLIRMFDFVGIGTAPSTSYSLTMAGDLKVDVLGTFDHTGTRFGSGTGPVADDVMSWHAAAGKWRPRFLQTQFTNGVVTAQNNTDGTYANYAFAVTYTNVTPAVPATPVVTPIYGAFIIDMGALPPAGSSYVVDYSINGGAFTSNRIIFTSQKIVHTILTKNGTQPFSATDNFSYKAKGRGKADGTNDSAYSAASANANYVVTTEVNAFGLVLASQVSAVYLSAITANVGSITAGQLLAGDGKSILQLDSTFSVPSAVTQGVFFASANPVPGTVTGMYIDFTATTTNPLLHHSKFDLLADGSAILKGVVRDANSKFVIDVGQTTARLITIIDEQAAAKTRVLIGEINTATTDWGVQVFADNGNKIVELSGTSMFFQDSAASPLAGVNIKGTLPGTWTRYLNLNGSGAMLHHDKLDLNYDGTAVFTGFIDVRQSFVDSSSWWLMLRDTATIAHGITGIVSTDVFGGFQQAQGGSGGLKMVGLTETDVGVELKGIGTTPATSNLASEQSAIVVISATKKSGTGEASPGTSDNAIALITGGATCLRIKGDGWVQAPNTGYRTADGVVGAPSYSSINDTDTGIFFAANNTLHFAAGGNERGLFDATGAFSTRVGGSPTLNRVAHNTYSAVNITTTSTASVSLVSYSIPATAIDRAGAGVEITYAGLVGVTNALVSLNFGATGLASFTADANTRFFISVRVLRRAASSQRADIWYLYTTAGSITPVLNAASPAENEANAIAVDFRCDQVGAGTFTLQTATVRYLDPDNSNVA